LDLALPDEEVVPYPRQSRDNLPPEKPAGFDENLKAKGERLEKSASELARIIENSERGSELQNQALCSYGAAIKDGLTLGVQPPGGLEPWIQIWKDRFPRTRECPDPEAALRAVLDLSNSMEVHKALRVRASSYAEYQMVRGEEVYRRPGDLNEWFGRALEYAMLNPAPLGYHWWAMAAVLGAGCQNRVYMAEGAQEIWPNWYLILGGRKNCGKSAAMNIAMEVIGKVHEKLVARGPDDPLWRHKRIKVLAEDATLKGLQMDLARRLDETETDPENPVDATGILPLDEMATYFGKHTFQVTEKYPFFNKCKNTPYHGKATGEGTIELFNTAITIIACCAPAWLRGTIQLEQLGGGFWDRCMVVYRKPVRVRAKQYPNWELPPRDPVECSWLAQYLVNILDYPKKIPAFLSTEAKQFMSDVHRRLLAEEHYYEDIHGHVDEIISAGRMTNFINQTAMQIALGVAIRDPLEIPIEDVEMATRIVETEMHSLRQFLAESRNEGVDCQAEMEAFIKLECNGCADLSKIVNTHKGRKHFRIMMGVNGSGTEAAKRTLEELIGEHRVQPCSYNTASLRSLKHGIRRYRSAGHDEEKCPTCRSKL
jgi:hypothetical protein